MTWKPPKTEEDWQECLSAYLDDELAPEARRGLEACLDANPRRAEQLKSLRGLSQLLREWTVEVPAPKPDPLRELCGALEGRGTRRDEGRAVRAPFAGWGLRWALGTVGTALFLAGVLVGVMGPRLLGRVGAPGPLGGAQPAITAAAPRSEGLEIAMSPGQAEQLAREVKAAGLKDTVIRGLDKQDWRMAQEAFETLRRRYPDSQALRELQKDESLQKLGQQFVAAERI